MSPLWWSDRLENRRQFSFISTEDGKWYGPTSDMKNGELGS